MARVARTVPVACAVALALLAGAGRAAAQGVIVSEYCPPTTAYYQPAARVVEYERPVTTYYAPRVSYYPARSVAYYDEPVVAYYPARSASYYAPVTSYYPGAVSVTRYGLFGRPRTTTTYYP